jgi:TatD DNase family protein
VFDIIDTHCHLDNKKYYDNIEEIVGDAEKNGVIKYIIPGASPKDLKRAKELSETFSNIYFSAGVHPDCSIDYQEDVLIEYVSHKKCVAIGECGLDFYRLPEDELESKKIVIRQIDVFIKHIELSKKFNKPLIIHSRDASIDTESVLKRHCDSSIGGVLHCFDGSENLISLKDYGFYFGIGGVLTFKNAKILQENVLKIGLEYIVLETDAPYLTPHPYRGKLNKPAYTALVRDKLSEIYEVDRAVISKTTTKNAHKLFQI